RLSSHWYRTAAACLTAASFALFSAHAQSTFQTTTESGPVRDAVVKPQGGTIYLAVYGANQVVAVDGNSKAATGSATVGGGPTALALSPDGATLACVNRLD